MSRQDVESSHLNSNYQAPDLKSRTERFEHVCRIKEFPKYLGGRLSNEIKYKGFVEKLYFTLSFVQPNAPGLSVTIASWAQCRDL